MTRTPLVIEGERVHLRDWSVADLDAYAYWLRPGHRWQDFDGPYYGHTPEEQIPNLIDGVRQRIDRADFPDPRTRLVIADREPDLLIGQVSRYWISEETN
ncbi:MAG: hypothetical protein U0452_06100 [Anaerolineae bacterium]